MATYGPPSNCTPCNDAGVFACTNLPKSNPIKGGGTIPANTPSLISNYMVKQYDVRKSFLYYKRHKILVEDGRRMCFE